MKPVSYIRIAVAYILMFAFGCAVFYVTAWQGVTHIWPKLSVMWLPGVMMTLSIVCFLVDQVVDIQFDEEEDFTSSLRHIVSHMVDITIQRTEYVKGLDIFYNLISPVLIAFSFFWMYTIFIALAICLWLGFLVATVSVFAWNKIIHVFDMVALLAGMVVGCKENGKQ